MIQQKYDEFDTVKFSSNDVTKLVTNILLAEENVDEATAGSLVGDGVGYNRVLGQLQRRAYENSFIQAVSPVSSTVGLTPDGRLLSFSAEYGGEYGVTDGKKNLRVVLFKDDVTFAKGDEKTTSDGVNVKIIYVEDGNKNVLLEADGALKQFETIDGNSMEIINSAQFGSGHLFKDYGKWQETIKSELDGEIDTVVLKTYASDIKTVDAKLRTDMTLEFLQDLEASIKATKAIKQSTNFFLRKVLRDLLTITMEQQFIKFAKVKATRRLPDLKLKEGVGAVKTGNKEAITDIILNINIAIGEIGTDTLSTNKYFVLASSNVVAALKTGGYVLPTPTQYNKMTRVAGQLKDGSLLIEDGYSLEDYFLVGLRGDESLAILQPSIVYYPYALEFYDVYNPSTEEVSLGGIMRNVISANGLDRQEDGNAESLQYCVVDMSGVPNVNLR